MDNVFVTGGAGFIGSSLVAHLNSLGVRPIIFERLDQLGEKWRNLVGLDYELRDVGELDRSVNYGFPLVHLAANVSTLEPFSAEVYRNNVTWPLELFQRFKKVIYASSASVYGNGGVFTEDAPMYPTNGYGFSKSRLDIEVGRHYWGNVKVYGLRFFNVYDSGNREKHKGPMESFPSRIRGQKEVVVYKTEPEARRDFVWVSDVAKCITWFLENEPESGVYNVGSGCSTSFSEIAAIVCPDAKIVEGPLPEKMKAGYQFASKADLTKLRAAGYKEKFHTLAEVYG